MEQDQNLIFKPSATQQTYMNAVFSGKYKYLLFGGSAGGGKSFCVFATILLLCKVYPGSRHLVVRETLQSLKATSIPSFLKLCPESFISRYNQDTQTITMSNGSQVIFWSENYDSDKEMNKWKGLEVSTVTLEEATELQKQTFDKSIERCGRWINKSGPKCPSIIMLTTNPGRGYIKELFYDRWKENTLPNDWIYVPSKITDNEFICNDESYMEGLKNMSTFQYRTFILGDWDLLMKTGGEIYKGFDIEKHTGNYKYDPNAKLFISFDNNVNPYLPVGIFQIEILKDAEGKPTGITEIRMIHEICARNPFNTVEAVCDMILNKYPPSEHKSTVELYGDSTAKKQETVLEKGSNFFTLIMGHLKEYKITNKVATKNEGVAIRIFWINAMLEKEVGGLRFRIDNKCKNAISDFVMTKELPDGTKAKTMATDSVTKVRYQMYGHLTDLTDYLLCGLFANEFSRYNKPGASGITIGVNASRNNDYGDVNQVAWGANKSKWRY